MRAAACISLACLVPTAAVAQQPADKVKLEVTRAELQVIGDALMEMPYKTAAPVMIVLQQQLAVSDQAAAKATADAAKPIEAPAEKPAQ